jgi:uncharacterized membrane protein
MLAWAVFFPGMDLRAILILALAGFLASFIDSALGAFLEPRLIAWAWFRKRKGSESISPNDVVNLLASLSAPMFYFLLNAIL